MSRPRSTRDVEEMPLGCQYCRTNAATGWRGGRLICDECGRTELRREAERLQGQAEHALARWSSGETSHDGRAVGLQGRADEAWARLAQTEWIESERNATEDAP